MEPVSPLRLTQRMALTSFPDAKSMYRFASDHVADRRQRDVNMAFAPMLAAKGRPLTEHFFLREYLWCVYVSGFSAKTISRKYAQLLVAHGIEDHKGRYRKGFHTIGDLDNLGHPVYQDVFAVFKNKSKAKAVQATRKMLRQQGWGPFRDRFLEGRDPAKIAGLPFMGPALSCQLARNLGNLSVAKPDVHLTRLAKRYGYPSVLEMCKDLSPDVPAYTDLVLWYACVDHGTKEQRT